MPLEKIEWLRENQLPSAAPAGLVVGEWWCPAAQNRQGTCHLQPAVLHLSLRRHSLWRKRSLHLFRKYFWYLLPISIWNLEFEFIKTSPPLDVPGSNLWCVCSWDGASLFCKVQSDHAVGNRHKLEHKKTPARCLENHFHVEMMKYGNRNRLPRRYVESASLKILRAHLVKALSSLHWLDVRWVRVFLSGL